MIKAKIYADDPTLAVVEASTPNELQLSTGTPVRLEQPDPDFPVWALVPADSVRDLLGDQSSTNGTP